MSNANRVQLSYIEESVWGSMPTTANLQKLRMTADSLNHEVETITSAELRSDRNVPELIQVNRQNSGGLDFELSFATFDDLFEGALFSAWANNILKNGVSRKSYSFEKAMLDESEFFTFNGMVVSDFTLNLATKAIATGSFSFLGGASSLVQASVATTYVAANTNDVINCMGNVALIQEGASLTALTGVFVQNMSFTVSNNLRGVSAIGYNTAQDIAYGKCDITGSMSVYFTSDRLYDKFIAGTASGIFFHLQDAAGNWYKFTFPKVKFETDSIPTPGQDQDVIESLTWRALYDSGIGASMQIERSA